MSGITYVKLPVELQHSTKGLIKIQKHPEGITNKDKEIFKKLDYSGTDFPVSRKDYGKVQDLNKINVNVFCYENNVVFLVHLPNKTFSDCLDLLLIFDHYVSIKDFNRYVFNKNKNKKYFCKSCLKCFSSKNVLNNHKEDCSLINDKQNVKL